MSYNLSGYNYYDRFTEGTKMFNDFDLILINGYLVDGTGREPVKNTSVAIKAGKIVSILKDEEIQIKDVECKVIDLKGGAILPGFINTHVHINFDEPDYIKNWLNSGVTTVRDMGILNTIEISDVLEKRKTMLGTNEFPRLIIAGEFLTAPGGYGGSSPIGISTEKEAVKKVDELLDMRCDFIKTVLEDGYDPSTFGLPKLQPNLLKAICDEAHIKGAWVSAHVTQSKNLEILVDAGINEAAHNVCDTISDELIEKMVKKNIYMVPTMNLYKAFSDKYAAPFYDTCVDNLVRFTQAGGKITIGTDFIEEDLPWFELGMPLYELQLLKDSGLDRMDIIVAATKNASEVLGLSDSIGTIENNKIADIIVVNGNPLMEFKCLTNIDLVIKDGKIIKNKLSI
jgi:imidazolonepropionase-like amidohydrolase